MTQYSQICSIEVNQASSHRVPYMFFEGDRLVDFVAQGILQKYYRAIWITWASCEKAETANQFPVARMATKSVKQCSRHRWSTFPPQIPLESCTMFQQKCKSGLAGGSHAHHSASSRQFLMNHLNTSGGHICSVLWITCILPLLLLQYVNLGMGHYYMDILIPVDETLYVHLITFANQYVICNICISILDSQIVNLKQL